VGTIFSNKRSRIAQELESEIGCLMRLWLGVIEQLGIDPASETASPFYKCVGDGKLVFGHGFQKLQKACFGNIKRRRFALITRRAKDLPNDDPRRMAF
jgi:hypothetical protein